MHSGDKKILRVGVVTPPTSLDPRESVDYVNLLVPWQIYETLMAPTLPNETPKPLLLAEPLQAESRIGQSTVLSARLRDDVRFSDGTPLTPQHVVDSLARNATLALLASCTVRNDRVVFTLKQPHARFDLELSAIARSVVLERGGQVLGTGAYMPAPGYGPNNLRLVRNPYFRRRAAIEEIEFLVFPRDRTGAAAELRRAIADGRIDYTSFLYRQEVRDLTHVCKSLELGTSAALLYFNCERSALAHPLTRRALAHAIDRDALSALFHDNPNAYSADGLLPPALGRVPQRTGYDLERARALLAQAGVTAPSQPLVLLTIWGPRPYLPDPARAATFLAAALGKLGFRVRIEPSTSVEDYYRRTAKGDYDLVLAGWNPDTPDPADMLEAMLYSRYIPGAVASSQTKVNLGRIRSEAIDAALRAFRDHRGREQLAELGRLVDDEMPVLALMYGATIVVHSWRLTNYPSSFRLSPFFADLDITT